MEGKDASRNKVPPVDCLWGGRPRIFINERGAAGVCHEGRVGRPRADWNKRNAQARG